jgi:hypothetical protein
MFTDKLAAETAALRLPVINVNASLTVGGLIDAVQRGACPQRRWAPTAPPRHAPRADLLQAAHHLAQLDVGAVERRR